MAEQCINGFRCHYELIGSGEPVVLVHGGWIDGRTWDYVVPGLAEAFQVVTYDRRGHSRSERPPGGGSRATDEADLAALVETLGLAPVHLVGNSYGASIALGLAARRPDLVRSVTAHEPPLLDVVAGDRQLSEGIRETRRTIEAVGGLVRAGRVEQATSGFVEEVALGPGAWDLVPIEVRQTMALNAVTIVDMLEDARWAALDIAALSQSERPILLTDGDQSLAWLPAIVANLRPQLEGATSHTFVGAGHIPHQTHPDEFVGTVAAFIQSVDHASTPAIHA